MGFLDGYKAYDTTDGHGSPDEWRVALGRRMSLDEANEILGNNSPWAVLEIQPSVSGIEIKKAWLRQAHKWHPDRNGNSEAAIGRFKLAKAAHVKLGEP